MIRIVTGGLLAALLAGLVSCSRIRQIEENRAPTPLEAYQVPPMLRGGGGRGDSEVKVTLEGGAGLSPDAVDRIRAREEDLMWTDPDNPEQGMEEMEVVIRKNARKGPWFVSYSEARRAAMREGKPLLVWFTDTQFSPLCRTLSSEVFSKGAFQQWAAREVIQVRLDFNVKGESGGTGQSAENDRIRKEDYLQSLKKRYQVRGLPTVLLLTPDGTVNSRYRGYKKTYFDFYLARLKNDATAAAELHSKWRLKMGRRGYREWEDNRGRTVFAKLLRYSKGELILVEPDGKKLRAREGKLGQEDQAWLAAEKAKRGQ